MSKITIAAVGLALAAVSSVGAASTSTAASAGETAASTEYHQQTVTGGSQRGCEASATSLIQQLQAQGYLVTFLGCSNAFPAPGWSGTVYYSK